MDELKPGYKFKHAPYKIIEKAGQGGQCIVYRGTMGREEYAVKQLILLPEYTSFLEQYVTMFKREYELLSILAHPLLPKAYNCFQEDEKYFIVVEFISGKNLSQIMEGRKKPLSEEAAMELAYLTSELLVYLTSRQEPVILRDIKPANIIITEKGQVKFIDLTIARNYSPAKKDTMKLGSPGYAPPEQYRGESSVKSDVYSLGVTIHEALTLHDPSLNIHNLPHIKSFNNSVSDELCTIIEMATELKPENRLSPGELNGCLKKIYRPDSLLKSMSPLKILSNEIYGRVEMPLLKTGISGITKMVEEDKIKTPDSMSKKSPKKHISTKNPVTFRADSSSDNMNLYFLLMAFLICFFLLICGVKVMLLTMPVFVVLLLFHFKGAIKHKDRQYIIGDKEFIKMENFFVSARIPWDNITSFGFSISDNKYIVEGNGEHIIFGKDVENWEELKNIIEKKSDLPCMSIDGGNLYQGEN